MRGKARQPLRLETADTGRIQLLSGSDRWSSSQAGRLATVAIEAEPHWLRSEALPLSGAFGE
jgi:hypothetical protein